MTLREVLEAGPAKANDLFTQLLATSSGALKTREKLFGELKSELELYAELEKRHLFPTLKKHQETKGLVSAARDDSQELRTKLADLDALPKDAEDFIEKLQDLAKAFQRHVRDEKKELLPAVMRAVSKDEVQALAGNIEASREEAGEAARDEAEKQKAEARREREEAAQRAAKMEADEKARKAAEQKAAEKKAAEKARKAAERKAAELKAAEKTRKAAERKAAAQARKAAEQKAAELKAAEKARKAANRKAAAQARKAAEQKAAEQTAAEKGRKAAERKAAEQAQKSVDQQAPKQAPLAAFSKAAAGGMTDIGSAWMDWVGGSTSAGTELSQRLMRCRTMQDLVQTQYSFLAGSAQHWMEHNARLLQASRRVADEALRTLGHRSGTPK